MQEMSFDENRFIQIAPIRKTKRVKNSGRLSNLAKLIDNNSLKASGETSPVSPDGRSLRAQEFMLKAGETQREAEQLIQPNVSSINLTLPSVSQVLNNKNRKLSSRHLGQEPDDFDNDAQQPQHDEIEHSGTLPF